MHVYSLIVLPRHDQSMYIHVKSAVVIGGPTIAMGTDVEDQTVMPTIQPIDARVGSTPVDSLERRNKLVRRKRVAEVEQG